MAKSFKQLSGDAAPSAKRTSEKDLLDFLEQDWLSTPAAANATTNSAQVKPTSESASGSLPEETDGRESSIDNISNTSNISNKHNTSNAGNTSNTNKPNAAVPDTARTSQEEVGGEGRKKLRKPGLVASKPVSPASQAGSTSNISATPVTRVTDVTSEHQEAIITGSYNASAAAGGVEDADVRQTFVLGSRYLEGLKNFVHTQRTMGQYDFTQKQALHQALDLLFATTQIEERPLQIRQKEEVRRQQIRKGKLK